MKKKFWKFFLIFPKNFFVQKIFISSLKVKNKYIEVENQFFSKLQKALIVLQSLYLPSNLYILIFSPVKDLPTQLIPEKSLDPLHTAEPSLNFCIRCEQSGIDFNQFHESLKCMVKTNSSVKRE